MNRNAILRCSICGMTLEVLDSGSGKPPICCGQEMKLLPEQTAEFKFEKHVPFPETRLESGIAVSVGKETAHPMTEEHHVEWIEVQDGDCTVRKYLKPGEAPHEDFDVTLHPGLVIRELCNLHGLWKYDVK